MDKLVLTPLDNLQDSLGTLLASLTTTPTFSTAPAATNVLLGADDTLTSSLTLLKQHQQNYARILHLRAEATRLEDQVKSIVRICGELRREIGAIHPSILDESSEDEDEEGRLQDVDSKTLLSFARRIGKHNPRAATEVEEDTIRRQQETKQRAALASRPATNGNVAPVATETMSELGNIVPENERAWLNETAAAARAAQGMTFAAAERLRLGMLGQLQYAREQGGEEAVEREVKRLLGRRSEDPGMASKTTAEPGAMDTEPAESQRQAQTQVPTNTSTTNARPTHPPEMKRSIAPLNLDLWNEDEEDED